MIIIDLKNNNNVIRRPIKADSAIMHWNKLVIALKAQQRTLQIFDLELKQKLKSAAMGEDVLYWKWISENTIGMVTHTAVFHWRIFDDSEVMPQKVFERHSSLEVSYFSSVAILSQPTKMALC